MEAGRESNQTAPGQPNKAQQPPSTPARDTSPTLRRDASNSHVPTVKKQPSGGLKSSLPSSLTTSPHNSRNTSPIRPTARPQEKSHQQQPQPLKTTTLRTTRDNPDASPVRPPSLSAGGNAAPPSAAAIQRALSAANIPQLHANTGGSGGPVSDAISKLPRSSRAAPGSEAPTPVSPSFSPRLKSPGPSAPSSRRNSLQQKKADHINTPGIVVQSSTPPPTGVPDKLRSEVSAELHTPPLQTPKAANTRGPSGAKTSLETVQEATPPTSSVLADANDQSFSSMNSSQTTNKSSDDDYMTRSISSKSVDGTDKTTKLVESDGDAKKNGIKARQEPLTIDQAKAKLATSKSAPPSARAKQVDGTRSMTVETETVASIPQSALSSDRSGAQRDAGGSLRMKPSNETIRPRKERKRQTRKTPSVHNGTASSKADIFEARVASAVDEANSSDSDETFVYESNPPEATHRSHRNHSRTPSVTSIHSQNDRRGLRAYDNHRVAGKRSMKFSNNPYSVLDSPTDGDSGTIRAHHPRNISRFGRTIGSNSSLYDQDSPFTQASKLRQNLAGSTRQTSRPNTPQQPKSAPAHSQNRGFGPWARKYEGSSPQFDFDGEGADDERTPLVGTVRTPRNRHRRHRSYDNIYNIRETTFLGRFGGCLLGSIVVLLIFFGAALFLFVSNKAMYDVQIHKIQNVLASEQEIMLDLFVGAINPNVLGITVNDMDVNLFAKSSHLTTSSSSTTATATPTSAPNTAQRRRLEAGKTIRMLAENKPKVPGTPWQDPDGHWGPGDDEGLEGDSQTMLLGRVFHFDQGLYFEGSPLKRHSHFSTGEFRLAKPGNKTEAGGSERWERVLQYPFELILRGVLRYSVPISGREESAAIRGSVIVHPEEGLDSQGRMRLSKPHYRDQWQWIEHGDVPDGIEAEQ